MRGRLQRALEEGSFDGRLARWLGEAWARHVQVVRPLSFAESLRTVGIGGATLGGSGKTAVALELARSAPPGVRVSVVTRSYPRRVSEPRRVLGTDEARRVGDEAVMLARALSGSGAEVWVGPRQAVLDQIAPGGGVAILDGVLQTRPRRLDCAVLSLEADEPWGAARCPPAGDLAASPAALLSATDLVLYRHRADERSESRSRAVDWCPPCGDLQSPPTFHWTQRLIGVRTPGGVHLAVRSLRGLRLGLVLGVGRPRRIADELSTLGIHPSLVLLRADHGRFPPAPRLQGPPLDAWLTTAKCATKLEISYGGVPVWIIEQAGTLPEPVLERCFARASPDAPEAC